MRVIKGVLLTMLALGLAGVALLIGVFALIF